MIVSAYDENGFIDELALLPEWGDFIRWARRRGGAAEQLVEEGWTENLAELMGQCHEALDPVAQAVRQLAERAIGIFIVGLE